MGRNGVTPWKDIVQYATAVASLASGIALSFLQYFNQGDLSNGILGYVAQTLMYAGAIFGVTMYWNNKYTELKSIVQHDIADSMAAVPQKKSV